MFMVTLPIFTVFTRFSPLIDEFWTVLCDSGLVRMARMRALKWCESVLHYIHGALPILCLNFHFLLFLFSCFYSIWGVFVCHMSHVWQARLVELITGMLGTNHTDAMFQDLLRVLWVYEETRLLPQHSRIFSVGLMQKFAFLPRKLMVSHTQGFCSLLSVFL